ncbi:MAG: trimeric intracellular cation channel family protein [Balneolales bacterium]|nr:trimeric intracellular cation channel family protein [Balneolales bacterium]
MTDFFLQFLYWADLAGIGVFAISGALAAGRKSLDWLGVFVIAVVTAIGGGTIRDLLLGRGPVFWIQDPIYLYVIFFFALITLFYSRFNKPPLRILLIADAFGLAIFAILGASIAESAGVSWINVIILGTITGVAGGIIRDVITNEIPLILRRDFYASAAIFGIFMYLMLKHLGLEQVSASVVGIASTASLRLAAIIYGLRLPIFQLPEDPS